MRGFDHIDLICRNMRFEVDKALERARNSVQVGANNKERRLQASMAYRASAVDPTKKYLLVDDVWTTGSSMLAACNEMQKAGARQLAVAIIARSNDN